MLHLCCAIASVCMKQGVVHIQCSHSPLCLSAMLMVPVREWVTVLSQDCTVPYAHDNHYLHIQCNLCGAFLKTLLQLFVSVCVFFCCDLRKQKKQWWCCLNLVNGENVFKPEVLFTTPDLETQRLKIISCSLCKKKKQTHLHVPTIHLDWTLVAFT